MTAFQDISLHYGAGRIHFRVPTVNVGNVLRPWLASPDENDNPLQKALLSEAGGAFRTATRGKRLCVLVPDATRLTPFTEHWPDLMTLLLACSQVRFLLSTGTHDPNTAANQALLTRIGQAAIAAGLRRVDVVGHHGRVSQMRWAGETSRGTPIHYNRLLDDCDVLLALSDVKVHYFGGYSNPVKNVCPGVCAYETVEANHRWALDERATHGHHPWHADSDRRGNPLAIDQLEATERIIGSRPFYALVTVGSEGRANWAQLGPAPKVAAAAFAQADAHNTHTVAPTDYLVVAPGGYPDDVDLYIAQRALELTKAILKENAEVLFLAACHGGVGEAHTQENFYQRLIQPLEKILAFSAEDYVLYSHKPYKFAQLIERLQTLWIHSEIPAEQIEAMHMKPVRDPQALINAWLEKDPHGRITFVDGANKLALYAAGDSGAL